MPENLWLLPFAVIVGVLAPLAATHRPRKALGIGAIVGTLVGIVLVQALSRERAIATPAALVVQAGVPDPHEMPECPHEWAGVPGFPSSGDLQISGVHTSVPEYHDCQRFLVEKGTSLVFDSLQAVFVREQLTSVYANQQTGGLVGPGGVVQRRVSGTGTVVPASTPLLIPGDNGLPMVIPAGSRLLTIGTVYSEGPYAHLGITSRFQCIVLLWQGGLLLPVYDAWMIPVSTEDKCTTPEDLFTSGTRKKLFVSVIPVAVGDKMPSVARWDWDSLAKKHYIGIACPTGWCELHGASTHHPSPSYLAPSDLVGTAGAVTRVKGWYDEQLLADATDWKLNGVDGVRGTVIPVPDLEGRTRVDYESQFLPAAWVALDRTSAGYKKKANFGRTVANAALGVGLENRTEIALCFVPIGGKGCKGPSGAYVMPSPKRHVTDSCPTDGKGTWFARIRAPDGATKYVCVLYRPTPDGSQPPPVVRWRWSKRDDLIWVDCPAGCCEVEVDNHS